eukprot:351377-Chlamydomonas_euryale.AAC.1
MEGREKGSKPREQRSACMPLHGTYAGWVQQKKSQMGALGPIHIGAEAFARRAEAQEGINGSCHMAAAFGRRARAGERVVRIQVRVRSLELERMQLSATCPVACRAEVALVAGFSPQVAPYAHPRTHLGEAQQRRRRVQHWEGCPLEDGREDEGLAEAARAALCQREEQALRVVWPRRRRVWTCGATAVWPRGLECGHVARQGCGRVRAELASPTCR